jgi:hypothetical protein
LERRSRPRRAAALAAGLALTLPTTWALTQPGCNYSSGQPETVSDGVYVPGALPVPAKEVAPAPGAANPGGAPVGANAGTDPNANAKADVAPEERAVEKAAILDNVIKLIQTAAINPGGANFGNAIKNLNQYFSGTPAAEYALPAEARALLQAQLPKARVDELESSTWTMPDARHVEDCMLYHGITARVAGHGDDLTRVRRVFDWMVRQVQLVPPGSLGSPDLQQAFARPFDVLLRGMATESDGVWSERGWLFLSLCRQLGLDAGLVTYTPRGQKAPVVWCSAVLVDGKPYLFDSRVGLPIPDAKGTGVATLQEAMADPAVLDRMDLPDQPQMSYGTSRASLLASASKVGILLDSGSRYFSPRMKLLQQSLAGKNATVLYRDPAAQRDAWARALGTRLGEVGLWSLPMTVETLLFTRPQFVESTQRSLIMFRPEFPLLYARMKQLRGETPEAVGDYVVFRKAEATALVTDKTRTVSKDVQKALDIYATYFLGMCWLDQNNPDRAEGFFEKTLQMLPEPGPGQPYYHMFRWGAQANLARLREARGDLLKATAYYTANDPTTQRHGNLLKARELIWRDPTAPCPAPLPPAPPPLNAGSETAANTR